jgi:shikimate kinase
MPSCKFPKENYLCVMKIYLIGYMGSGKSTLGKSLATAFGINWIDLDEEFERRFKISISDFFSKYGEKTFRVLEHKILSDISAITDFVISTGGGMPCFNDNMQLMNETGITVYLKATPELIISRIDPASRVRPIFRKMQGDNLLEKITTHLEAREPFYEQSHITVDATTLDVAEIKQLILNYISGLTQS